MILIVDFGSQTCHLIGRRIRECGVAVTIVPPEDAFKQINKIQPDGIIFSGGPAFVHDNNSPTVNPKIFSLGIPILAICYGHQLTAHLLGGKVKPGKTKEYGPAVIEINGASKLFAHIIDNHFTVWMSHGDTVTVPPPGFTSPAQTKTAPVALMQNEAKKIYSIQFHPEVKHTKYGALILRNFLKEICHLPIKRTILNPRTFIQSAKDVIGNRDEAIIAVSGGVDSTVAAAILSRAIGNRLIPIYIDNGLMRYGNTETITQLFHTLLRIPLKIIDAKKMFLDALRGVTDPEMKRKIIGRLYIECFEKEAKRHTKAKFLIQGTIYSDVIESKGTKHADKIKSHHNVGGLPDSMNLTLYEPLRSLYKDEVRQLGIKLHLPKHVVMQQPFPGPGQAIRIIGEVTQERLMRQHHADRIVMEEMHRSGWYHKVFQSFPVLTDTKSTAVKGDGRFYGEVVALRVYGSIDIMTASWSRLPYTLLQTISSRIVNEVPGISRVVYDITTKPPATMEWE
ncbi:MAG: glutamine-hydrolyzing GMP synthase [Patescibacteria group bacterium]